MTKPTCKIFRKLSVKNIASDDEIQLIIYGDGVQAKIFKVFGCNKECAVTVIIPNRTIALLPDEIEDGLKSYRAEQLDIPLRVFLRFYEEVEVEFDLGKDIEDFHMSCGASAVANAKGVPPKKQEIVPRVQLQHDPDEWW